MKSINLASFLALSLVSVSLNAQNRIGSGAVDELYQTHCASCHGKNLEGGSGQSMIDGIWKHGSSDEEIAKSIRDGFPELGMAPWKGALTEDQIRSLVIYIREQNQLADKEALLKRLEPSGGVFNSEAHSFKLEKVAEADGIIWSMDFMPNGDLIATQRDGKLWIIRKGKLIGPIKGIPEVWQRGQGGLLEVALHPDYAENKWIYLSYAENIGAEEDGKPAGMTAIVRGRIKGKKWVDQEEIFHVPGEFHTNAGVHFGSRLAFKDGYLFFSIGDRGRMEMAQDIARPNGKIHRIHDDGRIPKDNPFLSEPGAYGSIWSYGHRNPQGLDFHPTTGQLWETEHGPRGGDETNWIRKGLNFGWPTITYGMNYNGSPMTNLTAKEGMEQPKTYWVPSIAVCGIDFYEGNRFPEWKGDLFVSGMASQELHRLTIEGNEVVSDEIVMKNQGRVRDVANGPDGYLYVSLTSGSPQKGSIYRLVPAN